VEENRFATTIILEIEVLGGMVPQIKDLESISKGRAGWEASCPKIALFVL
jgi:hypothetical protein